MVQVQITDQDICDTLNGKFIEHFKDTPNIPWVHLSYFYTDLIIIVKGCNVQIDKRLLTRDFIESCRESFNKSCQSS